MGIFGFKNKFDIQPKEKDLNKVVNKFSSVDVIKINAKLVVPNGYFFVIGKKGKVCDVFEEGTHYFNYSTLPVMCRKYGIDKTKNGKVQDKIPADFYFVKKDIVPGKFSTYRSVTMGTKAYGIFATKVYGVYSYRVNNISEYMQSLLNEFDYIKTGEAEEILERWVNEASVDELEKQNFIIKDVIANSPIIADTLKLKMSKLFSVAGLELIEFKIVKYKLPKKYQQMQNEYFASNQPEQNTTTTKTQESIQIQNAEQNENVDTPSIDNESITSPIEQTTNENISSENLQTNQDQNEEDNVLKQGYYNIEPLDQDVLDAKNLLKEFGIEKDENTTNEENSNTCTNKEDVDITKNKDNNNIGLNQENVDITNNNKTETDITEIQDLEAQAQEVKQECLTNQDSIDAQEIKKQTIEYVPFGESVIEENKDNAITQKAQETKKEKTFVDLSLNEMYNNNAKTKRCLNCGMENDQNADHCIICGEKFLKGEQYD